MTEFISRNHGHECYEIIIKTTNHEHYKAAEDFARRLIDHAKPMTNADRIRQGMSDEELAKWMCGGAMHSDSACSYCKHNKEKTCTGKECQGVTDAAIIMEWLKQPAEV